MRYYYLHIKDIPAWKYSSNPEKYAFIQKIEAPREYTDKISDIFRQQQYTRAAFGPFCTKAAAVYMLRNPFTESVALAEEVARKTAYHKLISAGSYYADSL